MAGRQGRRGWGRIRQLPNKGKRYQASYVWPPKTGSRHNGLTTFSTRALAERWLADERRLIETGPWSPPSDRLHREVVRAQTFGDYATRWLEERRLKDSSRKRYKRQLDGLIIPTLGPLPMYAMTEAVVRTWVANLDTTDNERYKAYMFLHSICATAVGDGLLSPNPCRTDYVAKPERVVKPVILEPVEVAAAVTALKNDAYRAPALIAAWCGLRWGELGELRRKDISANAETVTVSRGFRHDGGCFPDTTKTGKERTVVVPPHIRAAILAHLDIHVGPGPEALLVASKMTKCGHLSPSTFRDAWHLALKASGCQRVRLHDLRHFCGTITASTGASQSEIMGRLGHTTNAASSLYQHVVAGRDAEIAVLLSAMAVGKPTGDKVGTAMPTSDTAASAA